MINRNTLNRAKFTAGVAPVALGMALAVAPSAAYAQDDDGDVQGAGVSPGVASSAPIVVTGTRVARPELESVSPLTVVGAEEVANTGTTRIEDLVNSLPQTVAGQNSFIANGASGTATVNLRGLGTVRTLVLINGRRMQPGDPRLPVADLNQIPAALIDRIEVVTGGASAVYGADAVAGVVNFIMDTDFEGIELDGQVSFFQHNNHSDQFVDDGRHPADNGPQTIRDRMDQRGFPYPIGNEVDGFTYDTNLAIGAGFDDGRGHVTAYVGYRQNDAVLQGDRDHSACALSLSASNDRITCGGSFNSPNATVVDPTFGGFFFGVADGSDGFTGDGTVNDPPYNYAPINFFQRPNKRYSAGFFGDYEFAENITGYAEFMFMDSRTVAQIAQSGTFFADVYQVRCGDDPATAAVEQPSPLLTPGQAATLCGAGFDGVGAAGDGVGVDTTGDGVPDTQLDVPPDGVVPLLLGKRNVEGGPRQDDLRHTAFRAVVGVRGDITDRWQFDVSGQFGTTLFQQTYLNDFSRRRLKLALDVVDDGTGNLVCAVNADATTSNDDPACAPYNLFQGTGLVTDPRNGITQAAINYVQIPGFQRGETEEWIVNGYVTGELFNITGATPVSLVLGAEYRKEQISTRNGDSFTTGDLAGQGGPTLDVTGEFSVRELFSELIVPIVEDRPWADYLGLELGYRLSDYTTIGTTHTFKIAAEYGPTPWLRFRGGFNRAVRAPNILELFTPSQIALFGGADPCAGAAPTFTLAQCANTGVSAAQYGNIAASPADQYNQIVSGNQNVAEEKADTYTVGAVFDGSGVGLRGLTLTVDYFNIKIEDAIQPIGAQTILNQCGLTGDPFFCNQVVRDPVSGNLWAGPNGFVRNPLQNTGGLSTEGIDITGAFTYPLWNGALNASFTGTYLFDLILDNGIDPDGAPDGVYDCAGFLGAVCGSPLPKWRHQARLGYRFDSGIGFSVRWRHFGSADLDEFSTDPDLSTETNPDVRGNIGSQDYFDLTANFELTDNLGITAGVNNIFDRDPPLVATGFGTTNGNTFANVYDPIGRFLFLSGRLSF